MTEAHAKYHDLMRLLVPISGLPSNYQDEVLNNSDVMVFKKRDFVFRQRDRDEFSFYLLEGELEMYADDQLIKQVEGGTGAAFNALAQLQPRQLSAQAKTDVAVLRVNRPLLDKLLSLDNESPAQPKVEAIQVDEVDAPAAGDWLGKVLQSELFALIPPSHIQKLLGALETVEFKSGDLVVKQGDPGDFYYIIQTGACEVFREAGPTGKEIKLAELAAGENFGEEALIAESTRNASVRMLSDGELARLTKEAFVDLIKKPVMKVLDRSQAEALASEGAVWLDVRFPEEHLENGIDGSINLPMNLLRAQAGKLDANRTYIAYCDSAGRSSAAAFLLAERGFDAYYVDGGYSQESDAPDPTPDTSDAKPASQPSIEVDVDADVRASALKAELARANVQLEEARRLKAEAEAAKEQAELIIEQRLETERQALESKVEQQAAEVEAQREQREQQEQAAAQKLETERQRIAAEAAKAEATLREAQRMRAEIEQAKQAAEEESEQRKQEQELHIKKLQEEGESRLQEEQARLQEFYENNAKELERIQKIKAEAEEHLEAERKKLFEESAETQRRLQDAWAKEKELEAEAQRLLAEQEENERKLRQEAKAMLSTERQKLAAELARNTAALQHAQREKAAAELARKAAADEAEQIIEEYKSNHEKMREVEHAKLDAERKKLQAESAKIQAQMLEALRVKEEAEAARRAAEEQVATLREDEKDASLGSADQLRAEIEIIETQANVATKALAQAEVEQDRVAAEQKANEELLDKTYNSDDTLRQALQNELDEWITEQEELQSSTMQRDKFRQQAQLTDRIRDRANQAQAQSEEHDLSLLRELEAQMESN